MWTRKAQNITVTAKKRTVERGVNAGDKFILKEKSFETENNLLSILRKKLFREVNIEARKVQKYGQEIFRASDVTSKVWSKVDVGLQQS